MNFTKNIKYLAISVVSIGTLYLGYIQFKNFQRRLNKLERDVRVIQTNIENTKRAEHFVESKPERRVTFSPATNSTDVPVTTPSTSVKELTKNMNILETITIEDEDIGAMSNEQLDKLEAELENYETESEYDSTSEEEVEEEEEDVEPVTETVVDEPLKEIHILNQYIHLNDEELHSEFSKNTCPELRDLLKKCGLSSGGKKETLIQRLISHKKSISTISSNE